MFFNPVIFQNSIILLVDMFYILNMEIIYPYSSNDLKNTTKTADKYFLLILTAQTVLLKYR